MSAPPRKYDKMLPRKSNNLLKLHAELNLITKRFLNAFTENEGKFVVIQANETKATAQPMKFPSVWLRDNCKCRECFHQSSQSRRINWDHFETTVKVEQLKLDLQTKQIQITFSDKHQSIYDMKWLKEREFNEKRQKAYLKNFYRPKPKHWAGADFQNVCKHFEYADIMQSDDALKNWLEALAVYGVAMIHNAGAEKTVVRQIAERVGFIRKTTYGEEFIVQSKAGAKNFAYLSEPLPLHTDLPYYEYKPSLNILHCIVQTASKGGSNLLVDAFHIADLMKQKHSKDYKILTETLVDWNDIGSEGEKSFHNIWRAPVICLDSEGNYARINHSIPQRDSHFSVPLEKVLPWYEAYAKFVQLARQDAYAFKTQPGDVLTFNNIRLLHGRTGYDDTDENVRYIVGAYLDWDIVYSKLRVLKTAASSATAVASSTKAHLTES